MEEILKIFLKANLARRIGLSNTFLNDLENVKVKKPDIEILRKIAEEVDLSLEQLLKVAEYDALTMMNSSNLENIIKEARIFKYDILDWDSNKRESTRIVMENLCRTAHSLETLNNHPEFDYSIEKAIEEINKALKDLEPVAKKYDYSKLPKDV